jgi:hypothetical protein
MIVSIFENISSPAADLAILTREIHSSIAFALVLLPRDRRRLERWGGDRTSTNGWAQDTERIMSDVMSEP